MHLAQDAGALGALASAQRFIQIPEDVLSLVDMRFRSPDGVWVGVTGRARTAVYNTERLSSEDLPHSIFDFTDPKSASEFDFTDPKSASAFDFADPKSALEFDFDLEKGT